MLARSKLKSIKSKPKAYLKHWSIMKLVMKTFRQLLMSKKDIENWKKALSQRNDAEKINLIEDGKKIDINEVIRRNEIINNSLK